MMRMRYLSCLACFFFGLAFRPVLEASTQPGWMLLLLMGIACLVPFVIDAARGMEQGK